MTLEVETVGDLVELTDGLMAPEHVKATWRDEGEFDLYATFRSVAGTEDRIGAFICQTVQFAATDPGRSLRASDVRDVPLGEFTTRVAKAVMVSPLGELLLKDDGTPRRVGPVGSEDVDMLERVPRMRESGPTPYNLRIVAHVYRVALVVGEPPTKAVRDQLGLTDAMATQWVSKARQRVDEATGRPYLGPAGGPGRPGA